MTDEALAAAADAAPMPDATGDHPTPPDPSGAAEPTARGAIDRAFAALEQQEGKPAGVEQKPVTQAQEPVGDRPRNPDGTFAPKEAAKPAAPQEGVDKPLEQQPSNFSEAPKRFSPDAREAWKDAPEPVRAEITRAVKELEQGIAEHQARWEPLKEYDALAKQHGTSIDKALANYVGIERLIAQDPIRGLSQVCENMGISFRDLAAQVMGQTPDENASQQDATIRELRQELAALKQEVGGVSTTIKTEKQQAVQRQVEEFAAQNPRFEELSEEIARQIQQGFDLAEAYKRAELLNPAPAQAQAPAAPAAPQTDPAHTRKGQLSLSGAPSSGSNPANRKPPSTARQAIDNAFANVGL